MLFVSSSAAWLVAAWVLVAVSHGPGVAAAEPSYYDVLEISEDASQDEIRKAYKRQALKWHPDRNRGDPTSENRFRELATSYEVLSDPERRKQYDLARRGGGGEFSFDFGDFGNFAFSDPLDLFKDLFGGGDPFAGFDQLFQGGDLFSGFDQMFQGFDGLSFQGFDQHLQEPDLFQGLEQLLRGQGSRGGPSGSSFSSFSFVSGGGAVKSKRVETVIDASGRESVRTAEFDSRAPERGVAAAQCSGSGCGASGPSSREARCAEVDASAGQEPRDDTVDHVFGSACCNARPQSATTDARGCCWRCAESPDCDVFVWQPSTGSCWLLRWRPGVSRASVRATDRVMGDFAALSPVGSARE